MSLPNDGNPSSRSEQTGDHSTDEHAQDRDKPKSTRRQQSEPTQTTDAAGSEEAGMPHGQAPDVPVHDSMDPSDRFGRLFHLIGDAVVDFELIESTPIVRAVNPAFEEIFGYDESAILGESLNAFIIPPEQDSEAAQFDDRTARGIENHAIVRRQTSAGVRTFLYRGIPYEGADGQQFGFAIYSDITEQRTYERHMQVIHRILRHNLRNDLTVIRGATANIASVADDPEIRSQAEMANRRAKTLETTGEEIRTLEAVLTGEQSTTRHQLQSLCENVVDSVESEFPDASVEIDVPSDVEIDAVPELHTAIRGLVENAIVHNTGDPRVRIDGSQTAKRMLLEIADDGPGIPRTERNAVFEDASITQLHHGSGLGLWLARCAVEESNGQMTYERSDGWTRIRLSFRYATSE